MTPFGDPSSDPERTARARGLALGLGLGGALLALAVTRPRAAAWAVGVAFVAFLARSPLASLGRRRLSASEVDQALFAIVAAFVLLPLAPDVGVGPYHAVNPQTLVRVTLLVLAIGAVGHIAQRVVGVRYGRVLAGFAGGFVTSTGTIGAMGVAAAGDPSLLRPAVGGAIASSVATVVEYALLVAAVNPSLLAALAWPLGLALATAVVATLVTTRSGGPVTIAPLRGSAFAWLPAMAVAAASAVLSIAGATLDAWIGATGAIGVSAVAGFVDAHASTPSIASLHRQGAIGTNETTVAIIAALSTNTVSKILVAVVTRSRPFALRVGAAVVAIAASAWLGMALRSG